MNRAVLCALFLCLWGHTVHGYAPVGPEPTPPARVKACAISPHSSVLAVANSKEIISVWDCETGKQIQSFKAFEPQFCGMAVSPDGKYIAVTDGGSVGVFASQTGEQQRGSRSLQVYHPHTMAFHSSGELLAVGGGLQAAIWDLKKHAVDRWLIGKSTKSIACSLSGKILALGGDRDVCLFDVVDKKIISKMQTHLGDVRSVVFVPGEKHLVSASADDTIAIWDLGTSTKVRQFLAHRKGVQSLAVLNRSSFVSWGGDNFIRLWDLPTGKLLQEKHFDEAEVFFAGYSRSLSKLVFLSKKQIQLLDPETLKVNSTFPLE